METTKASRMSRAGWRQAPAPKRLPASAPAVQRSWPLREPPPSWRSTKFSGGLAGYPMAVRASDSLIFASSLANARRTLLVRNHADRQTKLGLLISGSLRCIICLGHDNWSPSTTGSLLWV